MVGISLSVFLVVAVLVGVIAAVSSSKSDEKDLVVKENSVLRLNFSKGVVDKANKNPLETFDFGSMQSVKKMSLREVTKNLKKAKKDDNIEGVFLDLKGVRMNLANLEEVRNALIDFKSSGKWTIAYGQSVGRAEYYLASVCDKIYIYPEGGVELDGLRSEVTFYKGALEKLDIEVQVIRGKNNKFKSAVEPFIKEKMSDANRAQVNKLLTSIWSVWTEGIAKARNISVASINEYADSLRMFDPVNAKKYQLVDGLLYGDQVMDSIKARLEVEEDKDVHFVSIQKYTRAPEKFDDEEPKPWELKDKVAVIYAAGEIRSGNSEDGVMGSRTIASAIRKARKDSSVKAIVLRVNSPGGSALASDVMWRETQLAKEEKPFVVSMGGLAASGGYYISCGADRVFAGENTITGSIGVFGMIPNAKKFFNERLGLTFDGVQTNANAGAGGMTQPLTPFQKGKIQESVEKVYDTFLTRVSNGRGLTKAEVDSIGQGRVWTGEDAMDLGLVDEMGSLEDAIAYAADQAELTNYRVKSFPEEKDPMKELLKEFSGSSAELFMKWKLGDYYTDYKRLERAVNTTNEPVQARMSYDLEIK